MKKCAIYKVNRELLAIDITNKSFMLDCVELGINDTEIDYISTVISEYQKVQNRLRELFSLHHTK